MTANSKGDVEHHHDGGGRYLRFCGVFKGGCVWALVDDWRSKTDEEIIAEVETEIAIQLIKGGV